MSIHKNGEFGEVLRKTFRVDRAPVIVARSLRKTQIAVTQIDCPTTDNGFSEPIPAEDAFLITVQLRDCPTHDMFFDGHQIATGHLMAGTTCIYDLRSRPQANSVSPFHHVTFHLPRASLNAIAEAEEMRKVSEFDHNPGFGVADPLLHGMVQCLLPAFRDTDEVSPLYVDHITTAAVAHVVKYYGGSARASSRGRGADLTPQQLARVKETLYANLAGELTIDALACSCDLPPLEFARVFKRSAGISIHKWLLQMRLEKARDFLLRRHDLPLNEIASECGFATVRHLRRALWEASRSSSYRDR